MLVRYVKLPYVKRQRGKEFLEVLTSVELVFMYRTYYVTSNCAKVCPLVVNMVYRMSRTRPPHFVGRT